MTRYKCVVAYDGSGFAGYQVQPGKRTVQLELEKALAIVNKCDVKVIASGRTDAKVHASGQVIQYDSDLNMSCRQWMKALNTLLPEDIVIKDMAAVHDEFHARYDVVAKEYQYRVFTGKERDPFHRTYWTHFPVELDIQAMREAAKALMGTHDFSSFCAARTDVVDKVRTLLDASIEEVNDEQIVFRFVGSGFLYNMVRIMVGTLLEIGTSKRAVSEMAEIIKAHDRSCAGKTAPPQGLCLWSVKYE